MTRYELIARLEAATGPDVSLDIAIHSFINAGNRIRTDRHGFPMDVKGYTHSIEAAVTLVPAGLQGYVGICGNRLAGVWRKNEPTLEAKHDVPAIALCIAALKAGEP
ncbi:MAG: hypothetical protein WA322_07050 [Pseudolabrys sp.]|jgi:hypothetical protein